MLPEVSVRITGNTVNPGKLDNLALGIVRGGK